MEALVARVAEHGEVVGEFVAKTLVGAVMHLKLIRPITHLAPIPGTSQHLFSGGLPLRGLQVLLVFGFGPGRLLTSGLRRDMLVFVALEPRESVVYGMSI